MQNTPTYSTKLPRVAITIVYNGLHHLTHRGFTDFMLSNFAHWVVVEGYSKPGGSTRWCKPLNDAPAQSTDGTVEFMRQIATTNKNLTFYSPAHYWKSKDQQVNMAITLLKRHYFQGFLWQVDVDEHWKTESLERAEKQLIETGSKQMAFQFNHYVGPDLIAKGEWGSGYLTRLFLWRGQKFSSHEPARLMGYNLATAAKDITYDHYSYVFAPDVQFKEKSYGYENLYQNWESLQTEQEFPQPITRLFSQKTEIGRSNTSIIKLRRSQEGMLL